MKYKVKQKDLLKPYKKICIGCGAEKTVWYNADLPRPNTGQKVVKGFLGPMPGSQLGCLMGNHDFYGEHEVELA